jgi:3-polyprenyl-4-hydroxybenzoate decarboxylase
VEAVVDTVIARVLQHLGIEQRLVPEWGVPESESRR